MYFKIQLLQIQSRPVYVLNIDYADSFVIKCIFCVYILWIRFTHSNILYPLHTDPDSEESGSRGCGSTQTCRNIRDFNWADLRKNFHRHSLGKFLNYLFVLVRSQQWKVWQFLQRMSMETFSCKLALSMSWTFQKGTPPEKCVHLLPPLPHIFESGPLCSIHILLCVNLIRVCNVCISSILFFPPAVV